MADSVAYDAAAGNLWVRFRREAGVILVEAHDDGRGAAAVVAGNGLRGMRERLRQHGGTMTLESRLGSGFRLSLRLPVDTSEPLALERSSDPISGVSA